MALIVGPSEKVGKSGGSFQECNALGTVLFGRYCTIRDHEQAPPTRVSGRKWKQIFRTPDNTEK